jgi:hypothetical protein
MQVQQCVASNRLVVLGDCGTLGQLLVLVFSPENGVSW